MQFRILFQDDSLVVIEKPSGISVHPQMGRTLDSENNVVKDLRDQMGKWVYPVHRLDRSTSGVLVMAFSGDIASKLQDQFKSNNVRKFYVALARGWLAECGTIDTPLTKGLDGGSEVTAITHFENLLKFELPHSIGIHPTSRYSLLGVTLETGRLHQIRRHLRRIAHPIVGDTVHGDGKNNKLWRSLTQEKHLYLMAYSLEFNHPITDERLYFHTRWNSYWHQVFDLAGFCPLSFRENLKSNKR